MSSDWVPIGACDSDALFKTVHEGLTGQRDIRLQCVPDASDDMESLIASVRQELESALKYHTFIRSWEDGRIEIPVAAPHVAEKVSVGRLFDKRYVAQEIAPFFQKYGGWYAISQMTHRDIQRIVHTDGGHNVGPIYETMFQITVGLLRQTLLRQGDKLEEVYLPGIYEEHAEGYETITETLRPV
jgi:hypothetical protein